MWFQINCQFTINFSWYEEIIWEKTLARKNILMNVT